MNLFIYSDESGVFDPVHEDYFVFGGLIYISKEQKDTEARKYRNVEKCIQYKYPKGQELKACYISNKDKGKIFRSLNNSFKFGVVIDLKKVHKAICNSKKTKQRYLDYAYKIVLKKSLQSLELDGKIDLNKIENIYIYVDEHVTATDGRYELREAIEQEFKHGTFNASWNHFYEPITPNVRSIHLEFCNSAVKPLIRAADIVANRLYFNANHKISWNDLYNFFVISQP